MSATANLECISLVANADLSALQHTFVHINSSGKAIAAAAAGQFCLGVLQNNPTANQTASIAVSGVCKVKAGATIAAGDLIKTTAAGLADVALKGFTKTDDAGVASDALLGSNVLGVALTGGASGEIIKVLIRDLGSVPTTAS